VCCFRPCCCHHLLLLQLLLPPLLPGQQSLPQSTHINTR
jgi:hypothetical protein